MDIPPNPKPRGLGLLSYHQLFQKGFQTAQQEIGEQYQPPTGHAIAHKEREFIPDSLIERKEFQKINGATFNEYQKMSSPLNNSFQEANTPKETHAVDLVFDDLPEITQTNNILASMEYLQSTVKPNFEESTTTEMIIHNLLATSEYFVNKAHSSVTQTGLDGENYNTMIKVAIKSLLMILKKYKQALDPQIELYSCYKLSKIYFEETANIELADEYINKAISISTRNNLIPIRFQSEFLAAQIIGETNASLLPNFLNEKIQNYLALGLTDHSNMFQLLQINNLFVLDPETSLIFLQSMARNPSLDDFTRVLCLLYQSNLHLHRGSPMYSNHVLIEVERLLVGVAQSPATQVGIPTQLLGMFYFLRYLNFIQTNNIAHAKEYMKLISTFMVEQQKSGWKTWKDDGTFKIQARVPYTVSWLNSDEFVIMFYFLTGVNLLNEAANGKKKSKKVFDKCLQIIEKQLNDLAGANTRNFPISQLRQNAYRLKYIKFSINFYQAWMGFICNEVKATTYLNEFMLQYNEGFDDEEFCYYKILIPKVLYLFAVHYHFQGDLQAAKYFYLKVRNMTTNLEQPLNLQIASLQLQLGIGPETLQSKNEFNELFVYSTLHLLILTEFEVGLIAKTPNTNDKLNTYYALREVLHQDLMRAFQTQNSSNSFSLNFTNSNDLLNLTYHLVLSTFNELQSAQQLNVNKTLLLQMSDTMQKLQNAPYFPFIVNLISYMIYVGTDNIEEKKKYYAKCREVISKSSNSINDKIISIFILRSLIPEFRGNGEIELTTMAEFQLEFFYKSVAEKFKFLEGNIDNSV